MDLTPGFKLSEAGPIPEDWEAVTLERLAAKTHNAIVGGAFGSDLTSGDYRLAGVPVIRGSNMHGRHVHGPFVYVDPAKAKALEANLARPGDIVFTQRGTLGQVALVPFDGSDAYLISQSQMKASFDPESCAGEFIVQVFEQPEYQRKILASAIQTGVPHLNLAILRGYFVPRPPLPEQRAIAELLGDVDAWIAMAEADLAKLAQVKAAAMDALLTPTTRLTGFQEEWRRYRLGDRGGFKKGRGITRAQVRPTGLPAVRYGELYTRFNDHIRSFHSFIAWARMMRRAWKYWQLDPIQWWRWRHPRLWAGGGFDPHDSQEVTYYALMRLRGAARDVFMLTCIEALDYDQIGRHLTLTIPEVEGHLAAALYQIDSLVRFIERTRPRLDVG